MIISFAYMHVFHEYNQYIDVTSSFYVSLIFTPSEISHNSSTFPNIYNLFVVFPIKPYDVSAACVKRTINV